MYLGLYSAAQEESLPGGSADHSQSKHRSRASEGESHHSVPVKTSAGKLPRRRGDGRRAAEQPTGRTAAATDKKYI
ncbi:unnamed protein product [Merluccius merluccius]